MTATPNDTMPLHDVLIVGADQAAAHDQYVVSFRLVRFRHAAMISPLPWPLR